MQHQPKPSLTHRTLDALLDQLAPRRSEAAQRYEVLKTKLIRFFAWRGAENAEELADDSLDRMASKILEGLRLTGADLSRYALGIARRVYSESQKRKQRQTESLGRRPQHPDPKARARTEALLQRLDVCLEQLSEEQRRLILRYYEGDGGDRIHHRRRMEELQVPPKRSPAQDPSNSQTTAGEVPPA